MSVTVRPIVTVGSTLQPTTSPIPTAAWYGDPSVDLAFPRGWSVTMYQPDLPPPLSKDEILLALRTPVGAPSLRSLATGCRRVVIIVDDLTRPTPVADVLPLTLAELEAAGVSRDQVTILVATGTHGPASAEAIKRKIGASAAGCRLRSHDDLAECPKVGVTSRGTPVHVDSEVRDADLVLGIGGVYPQHSTGFGGGSKLALGVLGRSSIQRLHFGRDGADGRYDVENEFRRDLDDIAAMIGLRWIVMCHVDARRRIVRLVAGDPVVAYPAAAAFSRTRYGAPKPGDADVVIANAYPMDISATFMRSKGVIPLLHARPGASRILVAACPEGVGHHGLFPLDPPTGLARVRRRVAIARARGWRDVRGIVAGRARQVAMRIRRSAPAPSLPIRQPILLYQTVDPVSALPARLSGMVTMPTWSDLIETIETQQGGREELRVVVYVCAPLQVFE